MFNSSCIIWAYNPAKQILMAYNSLCRFSGLLCVAVNIIRDQTELKDFEKISTKYHDICLYLCPS